MHPSTRKASKDKVVSQEEAEPHNGMLDRIRYPFLFVKKMIAYKAIKK